jgi:4-hydroxy-2-oxoheptanedioate aldolase
VPEGSLYCIKRALDAGAWGIVVPMVDTPQQARLAIAAAKYPPLGTRSVGGGMHSLNFATTPAEYYDRANDEILVVLQTESPTGVANAEAIYSLPGCDAIFIGPADLESTMRSPDGRKPTAEEHEALIQRALAVAKRVGRSIGMHTTDPNDALRRAGQGMQFLAVSSDLRMMSAKADEFVRTLRRE